MKNLLKLGAKKDEMYIAKGYAHLKKMRWYAQRGSNLILAQTNNPMGERNWKIVQMKTLFHVLAHGHSMLEYETLHELFVSLRVPSNPTMHWFDFASWILIEFMHIQVKNDIVKAIQFVQFIALSFDEVTTIDNG
jgi:hypothetical protein